MKEKANLSRFLDHVEKHFQLDASVPNEDVHPKATFDFIAGHGPCGHMALSLATMADSDAVFDVIAPVYVDGMSVLTMIISLAKLGYDFEEVSVEDNITSWTMRNRLANEDDDRPAILFLKNPDGVGAHACTFRNGRLFNVGNVFRRWIVNHVIRVFPIDTTPYADRIEVIYRNAAARPMEKAVA